MPYRLLAGALTLLALGLWACDGGGGSADDGGNGPGPDASCESGCQTPGARMCQEGGVATCGDSDGDGCPEWSAPESCGDLACVDGQCVQQCEGDDCEQDLPPEAAFSYVVSGDREVSVNAAGTTDDRTAPEDLRFRWDWENDGLWDTELDAGRSATHTYEGEDTTYTIAMEVRDGMGQTATATRTVTLEEVEQVEGNVGTTTWSGNVVLTDDAVVGTDDVLTIEAGTVVAFEQRDADGDGVGDLGLEIHGTLLVKGTAEAPVAFTSLASGEADPAPSAWHEILLAKGSSGHDIDHAMIEFAHTGLHVQSSADIADLRVHDSATGLRVGSDAGDVLAERVRAFRNAGDGVVIAGGIATVPDLIASRNDGRGLVVEGGDGHVLSGCVATVNGTHGAEVSRSHVDLGGCRIYENVRAGLVLRGDVGGSAEDVLLTENGMEGVRALTATSGDPSLDIHRSNISQNGLTGNLTLAEPSLQATDGAPAEAWSAPGGGGIVMAEVSLEQSGGGSAPTGRLVDGQGTLLAEIVGVTDRAWIALAEEAPALAAEVQGGAGTLTVHRVAHAGPADGREIVTVLDGGTLDARWNWWGNWPDVLEAVTLAQPSDLNLQGFTGVPFADDLDTSRFVGGTTLTGDNTWSGSDVFVTGDVTLAAGATLTIEPGVTVSVLPVDQDGDGVGDYTLDRADGDLMAHAGGSDPVKILAQGDSTVVDGFGGVAGSGDGATSFENVWVSNGTHGIRASGGDVLLRDVVLQFHSRAGLAVDGDATLDVDGALVRKIDDTGARVETAGPVLLGRLTCEAIGAWCADLRGATHADNVVEHSSLVDAMEGGLRVRDSVAVVRNNDVQDNAWGLWVDGASDVTATANEVRNNTREGVVVAMSGGAEPQVTLDANNIDSNGAEQAFTREDVSRQAASGDGQTGDVTGAPVGDPGGGPVCFVLASYVETGSADGKADVTGALETPDGEPALTFEADAATGWYHVDAHQAGELVPVVHDGSASAGATLDVTGVVREVPLASGATPVQMTVHLLDGVVDASGNYWGGAPDDRVQAFEGGTVDTSDALDGSNPSAGPVQ
ncbi:MAG: right-handed parallel beta-helix repeat-containing protein [Myxococcota bacterium]